MFALTPQSLVFVAAQPIDFRKGIDGLAAICRQGLGHDPMSGAVFLFYNKQRMSLKLLCFDGQGFWLMTKRLAQGRFHLPFSKDTTVLSHKICYRSLYILVHNGDPIAARITQNWKPVTA